MAAPNWPDFLPQMPQRDSYSEKAASELIRSDMDTGPAKVRSRSSAKPNTIEATYIMTASQLYSFRMFVQFTLKRGAICFNWPYPATGNKIRARFVGNDDGLYTISPWGNTLVWQVKMKLEAWPNLTVS